MDWPWLYYFGTVVLGMSEADFWRCTLRKIDALAKVHLKANGKGEKKEEKAYIDQIVI